MNVSTTPADVSADEREVAQHAPRTMTFAESLALTLKLLGGIGLIGAMLWAAHLWTTAK